jgi:8-oxo-dGTP pyrophosphatase MutT (NUDIX family)
MVLAVAPGSVPSPAATVIVLRDSTAGPEMFLVRRHAGTAFMAGAHVFPGGRVDAADLKAADAGWCDGVEHAHQQLEEMTTREAAGYHVAAARELFEEAGVLLARDRRGRFVSLAGADHHARFKVYRGEVHAGTRPLRAIVEAEGLRLALDALVQAAHWVTPPVDTRRFDTRFFVTRVPAEQVPAHDEAETTASCWLTPAGAIHAARRGDIVLPPPTWTTVRELEPLASVDEALDWARRRHVERREPVFVEVDGVRMLVLPGDPKHPEPRAEPGWETRFVWKAGQWIPEPGAGT